MLEDRPHLSNRLLDSQDGSVLQPQERRLLADSAQVTPTNSSPYCQDKRDRMHCFASRVAARILANKTRNWLYWTVACLGGQRNVFAMQILIEHLLDFIEVPIIGTTLTVLYYLPGPLSLLSLVNAIFYKDSIDKICDFNKIKIDATKLGRPQQAITFFVAIVYSFALPASISLFKGRPTIFDNQYFISAIQFSLGILGFITVIKYAIDYLNNKDFKEGQLSQDQLKTLRRIHTHMQEYSKTPRRCLSSQNSVSSSYQQTWNAAFQKVSQNPDGPSRASFLEFLDCHTVEKRNGDADNPLEIDVDTLTSEDCLSYVFRCMQLVAISSLYDQYGEMQSSEVKRKKLSESQLPPLSFLIGQVSPAIKFLQFFLVPVYILLVPLQFGVGGLCVFSALASSSASNASNAFNASNVSNASNILDAMGWFDFFWPKVLSCFCFLAGLFINGTTIEKFKKKSSQLYLELSRTNEGLCSWRPKLSVRDTLRFGYFHSCVCATGSAGWISTAIALYKLVEFISPSLCDSVCLTTRSDLTVVKIIFLLSISIVSYVPGYVATIVLKRDLAEDKFRELGFLPKYLPQADIYSLVMKFIKPLSEEYFKYNHGKVTDHERLRFVGKPKEPGDSDVYGGRFISKLSSPVLYRLVINCLLSKKDFQKLALLRHKFIRLPQINPDPKKANKLPKKSDLILPGNYRLVMIQGVLTKIIHFSNQTKQIVKNKSGPAIFKNLDRDTADDTAEDSIMSQRVTELGDEYNSNMIGHINIGFSGDSSLSHALPNLPKAEADPDLPGTNGEQHTTKKGSLSIPVPVPVTRQESTNPTEEGPDTSPPNDFFVVIESEQGDDEVAKLNSGNNEHPPYIANEQSSYNTRASGSSSRGMRSNSRSSVSNLTTAARRSSASSATGWETAAGWESPCPFSPAQSDPPIDVARPCKKMRASPSLTDVRKSADEQFGGDVLEDGDKASSATTRTASLTPTPNKTPAGGPDNSMLFAAHKNQEPTCGAPMLPNALPP